MICALLSTISKDHDWRLIMRLVGTKTDFSGIQGIKVKIRIAWHPQVLQIITEVKLPDVTVQKMCDPGDSRLDFDISSASLIVPTFFSLNLVLWLTILNLCKVCQYWLQTPLLNAGMRTERLFSFWVQIQKHFYYGLTQVWYMDCIQFFWVTDLGQQAYDVR